MDIFKLKKGEEMSGVSKNEVEERQRLHTLVQLQAQEIEALKAEISILSRKGGLLWQLIFTYLYYTAMPKVIFMNFSEN